MITFWICELAHRDLTIPLFLRENVTGMKPLKATITTGIHETFGASTLTDGVGRNEIGSTENETAGSRDQTLLPQWFHGLAVFLF